MAALSQSSQTGQDPAHYPVPTEARMGRLSLTMAWWAVCSAMFYIVVGASLALSFGARNALIGMLLSVISYGLVNSVLSRFAIRSGLSVALFSRLLFGSTGACLATLIFSRPRSITPNRFWRENPRSPSLASRLRSF
jgi:purine-cytosine permease-like protein